MILTPRQKLILDKIVQEYVDLAQPVSSQLLEKKYDFGICPSMIRNEMQKLTDKGYLCQPHTSAGRIPTDKGYRSFVDSLLEKDLSKFKNISKIEEVLKKEEEDIFRWATHLIKFLAEESSNLTILHLLERDFLLKEGWEEVLKEPEFEEQDFIFDFVDLLESFEKDIGNWKINSRIKIFIGKENPFPRAKNFSIMSTKCYFPDEEQGIISLLGPKRMAYDKNLGLINSLRESLERS